MSVSIAKDTGRDHLDVHLEPKSNGIMSNKFSAGISPDVDYDNRSDHSKSAGQSPRGEVRSRPKLSLETAGIDFLISDAPNKRRDRTHEEERTHDTRFQRDESPHRNGAPHTFPSPRERERPSVNIEVNRRNFDTASEDIGSQNKTNTNYFRVSDENDRPGYPSSPAHSTVSISRNAQGGGAGFQVNYGDRDDVWSSSPKHHHHEAPPSPSRNGNWNRHEHTDHADFRQNNRNTYDQRSEAGMTEIAGNNGSVKNVTYNKEAVDKQKRGILLGLDKLEKKGVYLPRRFTMESPLEDMKYEYEKLKSMHDSEAAVKFYRNVLQAFVSGSEFVNDNYNPYKLRLDGWTESVMENIDDYDDVFDELHMKYSSKVRIPPELKLLGLIASSGIMTHLTNSVFKSSSLPDFGDVMRDNPDLMKQFQAAAVQKTAQQNPSMGGIFGMINQLGGQIPKPQMNNATIPSVKSPVQRKEMRGPQVPDLINTTPSDRTGFKHTMPREEDVRSGEFDHISDIDRISNISSLADEPYEKDPAARPHMGIRPTRRDAFIKQLRKKQSRKGAASERSSLVIDV